MKTKPAITKNLLIADIIRNYPETIDIFWSFDFHCVGCPMSQAETLEEGAAAHGLDVDKLVIALNQALNKESFKKTKKSLPKKKSSL